MAHVLIELKYTESANRKAFLQTLSYDTMYKANRKIDGEQLASFLVSSQTPQPEILESLGYRLTEKPGVYVSSNVVMEQIGFIDLNNLSDEPHNVTFKLFASRYAEYRKAFEQVEQWEREDLPENLYLQFCGLQKILIPGEKIMEEAQPEELTTEILIEQGKAFIAQRFRNLPPDFVAKELEGHPFVKKAHEEGVEEGIEKGRGTGQADLILKQLHFKFREAAQPYEALVRQADETKLTLIAERILVAERLEEVFAEA